MPPTARPNHGIGIWISGFFGSGKSLLMKILGVLLEGGDFNGQSAGDLFLRRLPVDSPIATTSNAFSPIAQRKIATTAVGGNLHSMLADPADRLPLIVFKLFAAQRRYTHNWPLAWAVEYQLDARNRMEDFRQRASELAGVEWGELAADPDFYLDSLYRAAADVLADHFSGPDAVERAVNAAHSTGMTATMVVDRFRRWCEARDAGGRRQKLLFQLDELGQWIAAGNANDRTMQVQALAEEAAAQGKGRFWLAVTAHGDVQALKQNVDQTQYAKIVQRFACNAN